MALPNSYPLLILFPAEINPPPQPIVMSCSQHSPKPVSSSEVTSFFQNSDFNTLPEITSCFMIGNAVLHKYFINYLASFYVCKIRPLFVWVFSFFQMLIWIFISRYTQTIWVQVSKQQKYAHLFCVGRTSEHYSSDKCILIWVTEVPRKRQKLQQGVSFCLDWWVETFHAQMGLTIHLTGKALSGILLWKATGNQNQIETSPSCSASICRGQSDQTWPGTPIIS